LYVNEKDGWRRARQGLPSKGVYYLDDTYRGRGWSDVYPCYPIISPIFINLVEYDSIGLKSSPPGDHGIPTGTMIPSYRTLPLHGEVRIEIQYSGDSTCTEVKLFTTVVTVP